YDQYCRGCVIHHEDDAAGPQVRDLDRDRFGPVGDTHTVIRCEPYFGIWQTSSRLDHGVCSLRSVDSPADDNNGALADSRKIHEGTQTSVVQLLRPRYEYRRPLAC